MQGQCARCKGKLYFTALQADSGLNVVCPQCGAVNKLGSSKHNERVEYFIRLAQLPNQRKKEASDTDVKLDPEKIQRNYETVENYRQKTDFSSEHSLVLDSDISTGGDETEKNFRKLIDHEKYADTTEFGNVQFEKEKNPRSGLFESSANIQISSYGVSERSLPAYAVYAIICAVLLSLAAFICYVFDFKPWLSEKRVDPHKQMERRIIQGMASEYKAESSDGMAYVKDGETAFALDMPESYAVAADSFGKAFVLAPGNDEITARYVESTVLSGKAGGDLKKLNSLLEMIDHGLHLKPSSASLHRARARFFLALGQPDNALSDARHSLAFEPENPENLIALAEAQAAGNPAESIKVLEKIISQDNYPLLALRKLAEVYFNNGFLAEAEQTWSKRLNIAPEKCSTCLQMADLYESVGMYQNAVTMYNRLMRSGHDEIAGISGYSRSLLLSGRHPSEVVAELEPLVKRGPHADNMQQLAEFQVTGAHMYILMGNYDRALTYNSEALKADSSNVTARYQKVFLRLMKNEIDDKPGEDMAADLSDLMLYLPKNVRVQTLLARLFEKRMQYSDAVAAYISAIKLDPSYTVPSFLLAAMHVENRVYQNAFKVLWRLADFYPDYWEQHPQKDQLADIPGSGQKLLSLMSFIEKHEVDIDELNFLSGLVAFLNGDAKKAAEFFGAVLRNNPEHAKAAVWLSGIYMKQGRSAEALKLLDNIKTGDVRAAYLKAMIARNKLTQPEQTMMWENYIKRYGSNAAAYVRLAELYSRSGDRQKAVAMAQAAFRLDPDSLETRSTLYVVGK